MNRFTLRVKSWWKNTQNWNREISPKIQVWIDKYKVIKVGSVLGIVINGVYAYNGMLEVIVLKEVKKEIEHKKQFFYKRMDRRKEQIFTLMKELEAQSAELK